ncbi:MAG: GAF domain-containing protein [Gammaproteobacteria bacterium TMED243]|nr:MAG: GAF domain-containing protein [Gammaproteobacteria bacterium TMED243]
MSLKRAIRAQGLRNFMKLGLAIATSKKVAVATVPANEKLRVARVNETGLIGRDVSAQFEIFAEVAKLIMHCDKVMLNLLDGACQYTITGAGENFDPLLGVPQNMTFCQFALASPEPLLVPDTSEDKRFADPPLPNPPLNCRGYAGFPLNTADGVILGTLCGTHPEPLILTDTQIRMMRKLATTAAGQIQTMVEQSNLTASRVASMLGKFKNFAPEGTINELIGFLDFCARGTALPEIIEVLERDNIITESDVGRQLTRDGTDLRSALGLAPESYRGNEQVLAPQGGGLDDLLGKLE